MRQGGDAEGDVVQHEEEDDCDDKFLDVIDTEAPLSSPAAYATYGALLQKKEDDVKNKQIKILHPLHIATNLEHTPPFSALQHDESKHKIQKQDRRHLSHR